MVVRTKPASGRATVTLTPAIDAPVESATRPDNPLPAPVCAWAAPIVTASVNTHWLHIHTIVDKGFRML